MPYLLCLLHFEHLLRYSYRHHAAFQAPGSRRKAWPAGSLDPNLWTYVEAVMRKPPADVVVQALALGLKLSLIDYTSNELRSSIMRF